MPLLFLLTQFDKFLLHHLVLPLFVGVWFIVCIFIITFIEIYSVNFSTLQPCLLVAQIILSLIFYLILTCPFQRVRFVFLFSLWNINLPLFNKTYKLTLIIWPLWTSFYFNLPFATLSVAKSTHHIYGWYRLNRYSI